jgi:23S rRNA (cytidine1920-2'-O)/16S rRNA (cytidine1409-2'-O)-methyltransferase
MERTNIRSLDSQSLPWRADGMVADLAFISLSLVLPDLLALTRSDADFVLLVKPQFELGKGAVGKGGVVRRPEDWRRAMESVATAAERLGLAVAGAAASALPGPAGNREFFLHLREDGEADRRAAIEAAVSEAPT